MKNTKLLFALPLTLLVVACGNDSRSNSICQPRCEAKAGTCGAPSDVASPICRDICAAETSTTVSCLESTSCGELSNAFAGGGGVCRSGPGRDGGRPVDGGSGNDAVGPGSCDPSSAPYCEGNSAVACEDFGDFTAEVVTTCDGGCRRGECEEPMCLAAGEEDCSGLDFGENACCGELSCNQRDGDRVCCATDFGCERDQDCCLYQPEFPEVSAMCVSGACVFPG